MNRAISLIVFILFLQNYNTAQTFEKYISSPTDNVANDAVEIDGPEYIILSQKNAFNFGIQDYTISVYKMDNTGEFIDSLEISINEAYMLMYTRYIFELDSTTLVVVGNCRNRITSDLQWYLAFINTDLTFLADTILGDTTLSDYLTDYLLNEHGNIIGTGYCENPSVDHNIVFCEYDPTNIIYRRKAHYVAHVSTSTIVELPEINAYHSQFIFSGDDLIQINRDSLSLDTIYTGFIDFIEPNSAINIPGSSNYIVAGKEMNVATSNHEIAFKILNLEGMMLDHHSYGVSDTNYYFALNEVDCKDNSYFFLGGTHNFIQQPPFLFPERRWIFINKLRMDGSIIWQHFYKGELNYMPYKVLATSDGGALILSHKYDWNSPYPDQRDIHILKVDSNGYYSGMVNLDEVSQKPLQILVYPNPASSQIKIATGFYNDLEFQLFNANGQIAMNKHLSGTNHTISVEHLPSGIYYYTFLGDGISERGKIIIQ